MSVTGACNEITTRKLSFSFIQPKPLNGEQAGMMRMVPYPTLIDIRIDGRIQTGEMLQHGHGLFHRIQSASGTAELALDSK